MEPIYTGCLLLAAFTLVLAVLGLVLARIRKITVRNAPLFCRVGTTLVLVAAYAMQYYTPAQSQLRPLDFLSVMVILGLVAYALLWACIAYQLNHSRHAVFEESEMLSMLYSDSQHPLFGGSADKKTQRRAGE
jgi:uncharacterized membrane protein